MFKKIIKIIMCRVSYCYLSITYNIDRKDIMVKETQVPQYFKVK